MMLKPFITLLGGPRKQFFRMLLFLPRLEAVRTCTRVRPGESKETRVILRVRLADSMGVRGGLE